VVKTFHRPRLIPKHLTLRTLMINQAREVFCQGRLPASLIYVLIVSSSAYEFRFGLLAGNRSGFTLPVLIVANILREQSLQMAFIHRDNLI
jgi:hypothetical protein